MSEIITEINGHCVSLDDLLKMAKLADEICPQPWFVGPIDFERNLFTLNTYVGKPQPLLAVLGTEHVHSVEMLRYLIMCNPNVVMKLISSNKKLKAKLRRMEKSKKGRSN